MAQPFRWYVNTLPNWVMSVVLRNSRRPVGFRYARLRPRMRCGAICREGPTGDIRRILKRANRIMSQLISICGTAVVRGSNAITLRVGSNFYLCAPWERCLSYYFTWQGANHAYGA